jgi:hypothetical protein
MELQEKALYGLIVALVGYFILEKMDKRIEKKVSENKPLDGTDQIFVDYVNPIVNFLFRAYPLIVLSVVGVISYELVTNKQSFEKFSDMMSAPVA